MAEDLALRVMSEYREMPGLLLTLSQASRLWQVECRHCEAVLAGLVREGWLCRTPDGAYVMNAGRVAQQHSPGRRMLGRPA